MNISELMKRERPLVGKIISDEIWLCGERRGRPVARHDKEVIENVCRIVLATGEALRRQVEED